MLSSNQVAKLTPGAALNAAQIEAWLKDPNNKLSQDYNNAVQILVCEELARIDASRAQQLANLQRNAQSSVLEQEYYYSQEQAYERDLRQQLKSVTVATTDVKEVGLIPADSSLMKNFVELVKHIEQLKSIQSQYEQAVVKQERIQTSWNLARQTYVDDVVNHQFVIETKDGRKLPIQFTEEDKQILRERLGNRKLRTDKTELEKLPHIQEAFQKECERQVNDLNAKLDKTGERLTPAGCSDLQEKIARRQEASKKAIKVNNLSHQTRVNNNIAIGGVLRDRITAEYGPVENLIACVARAQNKFEKTYNRDEFFASFEQANECQNVVIDLYQQEQKLVDALLDILRTDLRTRNIFVPDLKSSSYEIDKSDATNILNHKPKL
jgi:multidrug efflux pump subunit AcrA (membrane-fusion protein)